MGSTEKADGSETGIARGLISDERMGIEMNESEAVKNEINDLNRGENEDGG